MNKDLYLGDGAYAGYDGYHIWAITYNGIEDTNKVAFEPPVMDMFITYSFSIWPAFKKKIYEDLKREFENEDN